MKKHFHALIVVTVVGVLGSVLTACIRDSDANSGDGVAQADFDALKAQVVALQQSVDGLSKKVSVVHLTTSAKKQSIAGAADMDATANCTFVGALPADKPIYQATSIQCRSSTGYLFALPAPAGGSPLGVSIAYYDGNDCSGTPYVTMADVSAYGHLQGAAFSYDNAVQRFNVGYVPPDASLVGGTMTSYDLNGVCHNDPQEFGSPSLYAVSANDPAITGVSNDPYPGPVFMQ